MIADDEYLGAGRLGSGPQPELVDAGSAAECETAGALHDGFALADLAHAVALVEARLPPPEQGALLVNGLLELAHIAASEFPYDPALGDPWTSRHRLLEQRIGAAAGWLRVDRPRRESQRIAFRVTLRRYVLAAHGALLESAEALQRQALATRDVVMADSTYLQPAQPTTFGYVMAGHIFPLLRDAARLREEFAWVNRSVGGAGGTAGTALPVDRRRLAELLGFDGLALHARDAMWQTDGLVAILAAGANAATYAGQVAADLEIWASPAFGYVTLSPSSSRASALMPQKQNPYALSVVRSAAAVLTGALMTALVAARTPTARTDHFLFPVGEILRALETFRQSLTLFAAVVSGLTVHPDVLARGATDVNIFLADIASTLVRSGRTDYATAHEVLGESVRMTIAAGGPLTADEINAAAQRQDAGFRLTAAELDDMRDVRRVLSERISEGGVSPERFAAVLAAAAADLATERAWNVETADRVGAAEAGLLRRARTLHDQLKIEAL